MHNDLLTIGKFTLHGYSVMIALGFIIAMGLCLLRAKKKNMDGDVITDIGLVGVISGFLGAKILYIIVSYKELFTNPKNVIGFPEIFSGFVAYGGIIFGFAAILVYAKIKKINALEYLDFVIPFIAMIQGFGRVGCFLAGCCYGGPTDSFLGVTFPSPHAMAGIKVWPTQLFSAAGDFAICGILILLSSKIKKNGNIWVLYVILYAIGRFIVEFFRADPRGALNLGSGTLSTSQFISLLVLPVAIGAAVIINLPKESKTKEEVKEDEEKQE